MANLSLRPLAAAVGTSPRMLLHYFDSKEALIMAVMQEVQTGLQATFQALLAQVQPKREEDLMPAFWKVLSNKKNQPSLRLLFEVQVLALQNPKRYQRYLNQTSATWRELIARSFPFKKESTAVATLYNAVIDGLLLELLSTGDLRRTSNALALFTNSCQPQTARRGGPNARSRRKI